MRLEFIDELDTFAARAWPLLIADEANHTILLSALQGARRAREAGAPDPGTTPWRSVVVCDSGRVVAAGFRSRGNWLMSTGPVPAFDAIGAALHGESAFEGIVGPEASARACADACGRAMHLHLSLPLMRLEGEPDAGPVPQRGRLLTLTERIAFELWRTLLDWSLAFHLEAHLAEPRESVEPDLRARLKRGTLYVWLDESRVPACMVGAGPIPPTGARIAPVYTPPELRGRGYARAAVAAASRLMLERGARAVFLFTDASNPTSNALYQKLGFVPIGLHVHLTVTRPE